MLQSVIGRVRLFGMTEGVSFLILLGFAMPMKYIGGQPIYVKVFGWAHGALFILYCLALLQALPILVKKLPHKTDYIILFPFIIPVSHGYSFCYLLFIAAFLPFGPFVADRKLKGMEG